MSPSVFIDHDAHVTDSILNEGVRVGAGARLNKCIVDKNVVIPPNERIGFDHELDRQRYHVSEHGIVVIQKEQRFN